MHSKTIYCIYAVAVVGKDRRNYQDVYAMPVFSLSNIRLGPLSSHPKLFCFGHIRTPNLRHSVKPSFWIAFLRCSMINPLLSGGYFSGRVPAADRYCAWSCERKQIWFLLSHGGEYISIARGMRGTTGTWVISLPHALLTLPLRLLPHVKCPVCFLPLNSDMSGSS